MFSFLRLRKRSLDEGYVSRASIIHAAFMEVRRQSPAASFLFARTLFNAGDLVLFLPVVIHKKMDVIEDNGTNVQLNGP